MVMNSERLEGMDEMISFLTLMIRWCGSGMLAQVEDSSPVKVQWYYKEKSYRKLSWQWKKTMSIGMACRYPYIVVFDQ